MKKVLKRTLFVILALLPCLSIPVMAASDEPDRIPITPMYPEHANPRSIEPECYYLDGYVYIVADAKALVKTFTVERCRDSPPG